MTAPLLNWAGNVTFGAGQVHRPGSVDDLRELVRAARRVRALGSRHSFNRVADTDGDLVVLDALPPKADTTATTVTVAAGMTYAQVAAALQGSGLALANMASLPHISVAGSVATSTHGSGRGRKSLAAAVSGLRLITADGSLLEVDRETHGDRFAGFVVNLGALGVVADLTLDVEPAYEMLQLVRVGIPVQEAGARLDEMFSAAYSASLFTNYLDTAHAVLKIRTDQRYADYDAGRAAEVPVHPIPSMPAEFCTRQLGVPGPWHERLPHFRAEFMPSAGDEIQSEYFVPYEQASAAFAAVAQLGELIAPVLHTAELRTVAADDLWLSPMTDGDMAGFHFTWRIDTPGVPAVIEAVERVLRPFGARPHWGKVTAMSPAEIAAVTPRAKDFAALRAELDPTGKFGNELVDALFPAT